MKRLLSALAVGALSMGIGMACTTEQASPVAASAQETTTPVQAAQTFTAEDPLVIMAMGDSKSAGGPLDSWRKELDKLLTLAGVPHTFLVQAIGGVSCAYWEPKAQALTAQFKPDLVLLSCGTNDGTQPSQAAAFEQTYRNLLTNLLQGGAWQTRVVPSFISYSAVGGFPFPDKAPAWLADTEPVVNDAIYRALLVNNPHGPARIPAWADFQVIPEMYLDEKGVHPTVSGYAIMGRIWYNTLRPVYGWPDLAEAKLPCGMDGHRKGYGSPSVAVIKPGCPGVPG